MTKNTKFATLMSGILNDEPLFKGPVVYQPKTLEEARNDVISRAKETLKFLKSYKGGPFKAPMAWSVRNGIAIKFGYGSKNEMFIDLGTDESGKPLKFARVNHLKHKKRKALAIEAFKVMISRLEAGDFDDDLEAKLQSYRDRAVKGKAKRMGVHTLPQRKAA